MKKIALLISTLILSTSSFASLDIASAIKEKLAQHNSQSSTHSSMKMTYGGKDISRSFLAEATEHLGLQKYLV